MALQGQNVREQLVALLVEQLDLDEDAVTDAATFKHDLGADSLDVLELALAVEQEFGIVLPDADAITLVTFGDLLRYVAPRVAAASYLPARRTDGHLGAVGE